MSKYSASGVDVSRGYDSVAKIKELVESTYNQSVLSTIGGFGAMFDLSNIKIDNPVLVSGTDGVGSKLMLAIEADSLNTIGIDLVAMSVNDVIVSGASPLYFLDYIALNYLDSNKVYSIVDGIVNGCLASECSLIGGETAEMPSMYQPNHFDLAGFCVGVVDKTKIIDGSKIKAGQKVIGIASNGIHSNGFSLVRKVFFEDNDFDFNHQFEGLETNLITELLKPTKIYHHAVKNVVSKYEVSAMMHITGGGFYENSVRMLNNNKRIIFDKSKINIPNIFSIIQQLGNISEEEMYTVFNMGIGFMMIVNDYDVDNVINELCNCGYSSSEIGIVEDSNDCSISFK